MIRTKSSLKFTFLLWGKQDGEGNKLLTISKTAKEIFIFCGKNVNSFNYFINADLWTT